MSKKRLKSKNDIELSRKVILHTFCNIRKFDIKFETRLSGDGKEITFIPNSTIGTEQQNEYCESNEQFLSLCYKNDPSYGEDGSFKVKNVSSFLNRLVTAAFLAKLAAKHKLTITNLTANKYEETTGIEVCFKSQNDAELHIKELGRFLKKKGGGLSTLY